jgi:putative polyketide hydroxylase
MTTSSSRRRAEHYDVVVVGAGPSGLTTAVALARAGTSVLVVEKHRGLSRFPKATGLRPRTMEIVRSWGLEDAVLAASE